ncbi:epoxide hydrolase 4-like [Carassius auratus]|uniref:Epoxide hydrolase 4-like n=1 Tax=Carassius auratus TaxID=7957 RepID=A0A6P6P849_CARAU|nr:epoxide hydrolase 4-like [Carassius auratus]XP_026116765.1 epoxide hydrolase 4-like [Carassius auratus]
MSNSLMHLLLLPTRLSLWILSFVYYILVYGIAGITACLVLIRTVWTGFRDPYRTFQWNARKRPPDCLKDPALGDHAFLKGRSSGLRFHYVTKGDHRRPLMLLLHGFPENWYSWRYQLQEFSSHYHTVALDLRGCGDSDAPVPLEQYSLDILLYDIRDTIDELGHTSCILVGHDWGGMLAWHFALERPDMVQRLIVMNAPHPASWLDAVLRRPSQLLRSGHACFFQLPMLPEIVLSLEDFKLVRSLFCGKNLGIRNKSRRLTETQMEGYLYRLSQPGGLTGPLNYFRSLLSNTLYKHQDVGVPCMLIWGEADTILVEGMSGGTRPYVRGPVVIHTIPECSHWVQQDQPERVNKLIWDFVLDRDIIKHNH